jgi:hypothetical protein
MSNTIENYPFWPYQPTKNRILKEIVHEQA